MSAIERFFGTRPDVAPLLRRRGLAEPVEESAPAEEPAEEPTEVDAAEPKGHRNHAAVSQVLEANGIEPQIRLFTDATPTAASAAEKVGVEVGAIANSLIFSAEGEPVLIMTSGRHRVDTDFVAGLIGLSSSIGPIRIWCAPRRGRSSAGSPHAGIRSRSPRMSTWR